MIEDIPDTQAHVVEVLSAITAHLADTATDPAAALADITAASADLLGAAAGVLVVDPRGGVAVVAASDERARIVELLQAQGEHGPCLDAVAAGTPVEVPDLSESHRRWPEFTDVATTLGYRAVLAIPMLLDGHAIGGLNVFYTTVREFTDYDRRLAAVLAASAVMHLIRDDAAHRRAKLTERTLGPDPRPCARRPGGRTHRRTLHITPAAARTLLEHHASTHHTPLRALAQHITTGSLAPADLTGVDDTAPGQQAPHPDHQALRWSHRTTSGP
ncbi:GAF domain-containing protein [Rhodococcus opacus]|nr:GAF domain-containing protein [Rhodococcus opacus]